MLEFYKNKNVLITGHTGFKGSWLCKILTDAGATVTGYGLRPTNEQKLFEILNLSEKMNSVIGDIRDIDELKKVFEETKPELVIHMAAQPLVIESYNRPLYTYDVNVMGTVNILECIRTTSSVKSFLNVTTDKVYRNREWEWGYRENEELNGFDPYSNSKSCSELVTASYNSSFLKEQGIAVSTARAGNVIGGGDYASNRIIPDCIRAARDGEKLLLRNPNSIRPYQHVLEPLAAYLLILKSQYDDIGYADNYNVGPQECDCIETGNLVEIFSNDWKKLFGTEMSYESKNGNVHEANFLKLDCAKLRNKLSWEPKWNVSCAVQKIVEWERALDLGNVIEVTEQQIANFFSL